MSRPVLCLPLLALAIAGCGASATPEAPTAPATTSAPSTAALSVGATDLRLGGAVTDDGSGARALEGPSRPDPDELRASARDREGVGAGDSCPDQDLQPTEANAGQVVASTLCLLNGQRADAGLGPLATDDKLARAALVQSRDMVANSFFSHTGKDGSSSTDRIRVTGYIPTDREWTVGENLAWGTGNLATPRNIVLAWMNSPGHRENIMRPVFNQIGFGLVIGNPSRGDGLGATYTTTFGSLGGSGGGAADAEPVDPATAPRRPSGSGSRGLKSTTASSRSRKAKRKRAKAARAKAARRAARTARGTR